MKRVAKQEGVPARHYQAYRCPFCAGFHFGHTRMDIEASRREIERYAEGEI